VLAVGAQCDEGEGGARPGVEDDTAVVDTIVTEDDCEHAAELVVPELSNEGGPEAEARYSDSQVGPTKAAPKPRRDTAIAKLVSAPHGALRRWAPPPATPPPPAAQRARSSAANRMKHFFM
jgi:hypothetical protein